MASSAVWCDSEAGKGTLSAELWSVADTDVRPRPPAPDGSTTVRSLPRGSRHGRSSRRALPGSRALAGGFLVAVAAVGLFGALTRSNANHLKPVVVAAHELTAGQAIGPEDVRVIA